MKEGALQNMSVLPCRAPEIIQSLLERDRRLLLYGPPGIGKSTLATQLGQALSKAKRTCWCLGADPGSPSFGVPGAVTLGLWGDDAWQVMESMALCSLDAGRFRLPLVSAVQTLAQTPLTGTVLLDSPGVVRGMAGKELLSGLVAAADIDGVLALTLTDRSPPLWDELQALGIPVYMIHASGQAIRPGKQARARRRTQQWGTYLVHAVTQRIDLGQMNLIGSPPPLGEAGAWAGRQLALLHNRQTLAMGEVQELDGKRLTALFPVHVTDADTVLVRDALRSPNGLIETAIPFTSERLDYIPPADVVPSVQESGGARIVGRVGHVDVGLLNGVFGDPQLHLRLRHLGRSLMFDIGSGTGTGGRLPARLAHQVTDVFISHAHMDHISGFQWLLRSRLGDLPPCRVYGPPGLAQHIHGFIQCFLWDRIQDRGPVFEVAELHGDRLHHYRIQAGKDGCEYISESPVAQGIIHEEAGFRIRVAKLDHHTPVLAYAYEPEREMNVRKDRLAAQGLDPGPWLAALKQAVLTDNRGAMITLPDGRNMAAGPLGDDLVLIKSGKRLVYATDLADTAENRRRLMDLAHHAHTFFCEAPFMEADAEQAARTGHLTTRACGEIAAAAGVARLVPFHFSRRYAHDPQQVYDEIGAACSCLVAPASPKVFEAQSLETTEEFSTNMGGLHPP